MKELVGTSSLKRENFMKMIEDGRQKKFDLIVAKEVSRFSRDTIDSLFYTRKLLEYDVCVYFLSDNIITASNDGELRLTIMSSMAQDEVRKISERTKFGFKRALEKGTVLGTNNIWGYRKEKGKLVIYKKEALLVKEIFSIYASNPKIGLKKLSLLLQEKGYFNRNKNPLHPNTLKNIIQNPRYKGYYTGGLSTVIDYRSKKRNFNKPNEWKIFKDYDKVPPIVTEELWEKANQKLCKRSSNTKGNQKYQNHYPLSGKLYCEKHQCGFVRKVRHYQNKEDVIYWYCKDFHTTGKKNCNPAYFKQDDIYTLLFSLLKNYEVYKEEIAHELFSLYLQFSKETNFFEEEQKLQNALHLLSIKKEKLIDLVLDGFLTKEDFQLKKEEIELDITQIQNSLKELVILKAKSKEQEKYEEGLKNIILKELEIGLENLENYIEQLVEKIVVREKGKEIELEILLVGNHVIYKNILI